MKQPANLKEVLKYARDAVKGKIIVGKEVALACQRFLNDYNGKQYIAKPDLPERAIRIIESTLCYREGRDPETGAAYNSAPFRLQPWQKFHVYNLIGIYDRKTGHRKYRESFTMVPRKNGKTPFVAALAWAMAIIQATAGASVYVVAASLNQAMETFNFLAWNVRRIDPKGKTFRIKNNSTEHSISANVGMGFIYIRVLAYNPKAMDSFKATVTILDELHAFQGPDAYFRMQESNLSEGTNGLTMAITTAGDNQNSFCYRRQQLCVKILRGETKKESQFAFISRADMDPDTGLVDFTDPIQIRKANPSVGVTVSLEVLLQEAQSAQEDPDKRRAFLSRNLDWYTSSAKAYFDLDKVRLSDQRYNWTLEELAKLPIRWYGGTDLSKLNDLTAACLWGTLHNYRDRDGRLVDVDICIPHVWFPRPMAEEKAQKEDIPVFGWESDGWLTMCNQPTIDTDAVVRWFIEMKKRGFRIAQVGHDSKFSREYVLGMKAAHFRIIDQPQYYWAMSAGFRKLEYRIANRVLYYLHAEPFEYCIGNVRAVETSRKLMAFTKIDAGADGNGGVARIDVFTAAVIAAIRQDEDLEKQAKQERWKE